MNSESLNEVHGVQGPLQTGSQSICRENEAQVSLTDSDVYRGKNSMITADTQSSLFKFERVQNSKDICTETSSEDSLADVYQNKCSISNGYTQPPLHECEQKLNNINLTDEDKSGLPVPHKDTEDTEQWTETFPNQKKGHHIKTLTEKEILALEKDQKLVSEFKQNKLEIEARKNWDLFYKRNTTNFFKDRHWTAREFEELCCDGASKSVLEVGCGVGNFIFPLLQENPNLFFYACDFSPRAVQFVKNNPLYTDDRCHAFTCDLTSDDLCVSIPPNTVDLVTMIFVLSAIHPDKMNQALENVQKVLKPGGCVLFRDYGLYDHAMLRFSPGHKLMENFYVRQDGTRAYYFSEELLSQLFQGAGFTVINNEYILRKTENKKEGLSVDRVFVQGKFQKSS